MRIITKIKRLHSIFFKLLISYIAILFIAMSIGGTVYFKAGRIIEEESNRYNDAMLKQVSQAIDTQLKDMHQLSVQIAYNRNLLDFLRPGGVAGSEKDRYVSGILKDVFEHKSRNQFIYDLFIYDKNNDMILSPTGYWKSDFFYNSFYGYKNIDYSSWQSFLENFRGGPDYVPLQTMNIGRWKSNMITYVYPLVQGVDKYTGSLVMLIDEQGISKFLNNIENVNKSTLYVIDGKRRLIASTVSDYDLPTSLMNEKAPFIDKLSGRSGIVYDQLNGNEVVVSYTSSFVNDWKYISVVPTHIFMEKVDAIKKFIFMVSLFSLLIGILIALFMTYRNYNPVKELMHLLTDKIDRPVKPLEKNEYDFIRETMLSIMDENQSVKNMLQQQQPLIKSNFISRLIKGNITINESIIDSLNFFNIKFISDKFVVLLFNIDSCGNVVNGGAEHEWALARLVCAKSIEEAAGDDYMIYAVDMDKERLAILVNIDENHNGKYSGSIIDIAERVRVHLKEEFNIVLTISIGKIYTGMASIAESYKEALAALSYKITRGNNSIICFSEIFENSRQYYYTLEIELKLINYVKAGEIKEAENIIDKIFHENFVVKSLPYRLIQCLYFDIMSTAIKTLNEIKIDYADIFGVGFDPVTELLECQTVAEMHKTTRSIYRQICKFIIDNRKSHNTCLKEKIAQYIHNNYSDINLSVAAIAKEMSLNSSYLSHFFKEQTDNCITDYINEIRINKAMELLNDRRLTINEIAGTVGFGTANTFIRVFKKDKGITPGEFRNKLVFQEI